MGNKAKILIVDDDPGMTETLSDILDEMGYDVAVASDGCKAIEIIREKPCDVALIDIRMPGINGVETFREVKRIRPEVGTIMMTAYSGNDLVSEALEEGAYQVICKPFEMDRLISLLEDCCGGRD